MKINKQQRISKLLCEKSFHFTTQNNTIKNSIESLKEKPKKKQKRFEKQNKNIKILKILS